MKLSKLSLNLVAILALFCLVAIAQEAPKAASATAAPVDSAKVKVIELPADVAIAVKELREAFDTAQTQKALIEARVANIQAMLAVQFNRACAKAKLDPDLYEWSADLSGLRLKTPPKK